MLEKQDYLSFKSDTGKFKNPHYIAGGEIKWQG